MNQDEHKIMVRRMVALIAVASVLIAVYVLRLIFLQPPAATSWTAPDAASQPAPPATMWS